MTLYNGLFIITVALLIVAGICLGLLIALVVFTFGRRSSPPALSSNTPTPINQNKRIANSTAAMSAGLPLIVFSANLIPMGKNSVLAIILLVSGLAAIAWAWCSFQRT